MFEAWTLREDSVNAEDERLRAAILALNDSDRVNYFREYNRALKDPDTYAVLNWFFLAGLHHYYLGKFFRGTINLLLMIIGFFALFILPLLGTLLISGVVLIEIPALFRSQIIVADHNTKLGRRILHSERITGSSRTGHVSSRCAPWQRR